MQNIMFLHCFFKKIMFVSVLRRQYRRLCPPGPLSPALPYTRRPALPFRTWFYRDAASWYPWRVLYLHKNIKFYNIF